MDRQSVRDMVRGALVVVFGLLCGLAVNDYLTTRHLVHRTAQAVLMILDIQEMRAEGGGGCRL